MDSYRQTIKVRTIRAILVGGQRIAVSRALLARNVTFDDIATSQKQDEDYMLLFDLERGVRGAVRWRDIQAFEFTEEPAQ